MTDEIHLEDDSWFRFFRKTEHSEVFKNAELLQLWVWCLMRVTYKERKVCVVCGRAKRLVHLKPGQFIFGRDSAAKAVEQKSSSVWKRMMKLKKMGNVDIESNSDFSIVTVCNWQTYQGLENEKEQRKEQRCDSDVTAKEQRGDTNKKVKKVKKVVEGKENKQPLPPEGGEPWSMPYLKKNGEEYSDAYKFKIWFIGELKRRFQSHYIYTAEDAKHVERMLNAVGSLWGLMEAAEAFFQDDYVLKNKLFKLSLMQKNFMKYTAVVDNDARPATNGSPSLKDLARRGVI
jgi:hypothetical protein